MAGNAGAGKKRRGKGEWQAIATSRARISDRIPLYLRLPTAICEHARTFGTCHSRHQ